MFLKKKKMKLLKKKVKNYGNYFVQDDIDQKDAIGLA